MPLYVDNFLDFPVGSIVPVGWYDRDKAAWIPSENGRVMQIVALANGYADLDTDGDGSADDATKLQALGITDAEREHLATLYSAGRSFWRTPITHFTPWDCNWPYGPPADATAPSIEPRTGDDVQPDPEDSNECEGCSIEAQSQTLGEKISLTGAFPSPLPQRSRAGEKERQLDRHPPDRGFGVREPTAYRSQGDDSGPTAHRKLRAVAQSHPHLYLGWHGCLWPQSRRQTERRGARRLRL